LDYQQFSGAVASSEGSIGYTPCVFLIDQEGALRFVYPPDFARAWVVADMQRLLDETARN